MTASKGYLDLADYRTVIECTPVLCVDIDLQVPDGHLLFRRAAEPLKNEWWVVGGRVWKGELADAAVRRKIVEELGHDFYDRGLPDKTPRFHGFYQEIFEFSSLGRGKYHAVSLVFSVQCNPDQLGVIRLDTQHTEWKVAPDLPPGFVTKYQRGGW